MENTRLSARAYETVENNTDATVDQKEEIKKNLKALEEELENKEADAGKIQRAWKWIQRNASWLVPTLSQVVIEGTKIVLGGH